VNLFNKVGFHQIGTNSNWSLFTHNQVMNKKLYKLIIVFWQSRKVRITNNVKSCNYWTIRLSFIEIFLSTKQPNFCYSYVDKRYYAY